MYIYLLPSRSQATLLQQPATHPRGRHNTHHYHSSRRRRKVTYPDLATLVPLLLLLLAVCTPINALAGDITTAVRIGKYTSSCLLRSCTNAATPTSYCCGNYLQYTECTGITEQNESRHHHQLTAVATAAAVKKKNCYERCVLEVQ